LGRFSPRRRSSRTPFFCREKPLLGLLASVALSQTRKPEDAGDTLQGQITLLQVRGGLLYLTLYLSRNTLWVTTRQDLYDEMEKGNQTRRLFRLRPGDILYFFFLYFIHIDADEKNATVSLARGRVMIYSRPRTPSS
jgi:hypothetical protein